LGAESGRRCGWATAHLLLLLGFLLLRLFLFLFLLFYSGIFPCLLL